MLSCVFNNSTTLKQMKFMFSVAKFSFAISTRYSDWSIPVATFVFDRILESKAPLPQPTSRTLSCCLILSLFFIWLSIRSNCSSPTGSYRHRCLCWTGHPGKNPPQHRLPQHHPGWKSKAVLRPRIISWTLWLDADTTTRWRWTQTALLHGWSGALSATSST